MRSFLETPSIHAERRVKDSHVELQPLVKQTPWGGSGGGKEAVGASAKSCKAAKKPRNIPSDSCMKPREKQW